ncbi:hypothetical protein E2562_000410 [Oryza meyeriana var. granulata]|uniref:Uncharacterized protein n=1 Tax=Oryza meyeriana var. granulata TaxID=110450 RepID=A0A6G1CC06_9ORYZ|nr:hypothetical protein E2562_000410 [Oryza meyeriana var. granulata]
MKKKTATVTVRRGEEAAVRRASGDGVPRARPDPVTVRKAVAMRWTDWAGILAMQGAMACLCWTVGHSALPSELVYYFPRVVWNRFAFSISTHPSEMLHLGHKMPQLRIKGFLFLKLWHCMSRGKCHT